MTSNIASGRECLVTFTLGGLYKGGIGFHCSFIMDSIVQLVNEQINSSSTFTNLTDLEINKLYKIRSYEKIVDFEVEKLQVALVDGANNVLRVKLPPRVLFDDMEKMSKMLKQQESIGLIYKGRKEGRKAIIEFKVALY
jgi:hypothetical protein